jgi:hypothetical protein
MAKKIKDEEEEIIESPVIVEQVIIEEVKRIVDLDKIVNHKTKQVLEDVTDNAIMRTFELLGLSLEHIETVINQYASQDFLQALFYINELDYVVDKKRMINKIAVYLKK